MKKDKEGGDDEDPDGGGGIDFGDSDAENEEGGEG